MEPTSVICPVCGSVVDTLGPGPGGRPNACCRQCGSLERHRFLTLLLPAVADHIPATGVLVDVAPSPQVSSHIRRISPERYVSIDFDPAADGRLVDVAASLTDLPFRDDSCALMVCYHVLEHIPDDAAAMREIARVMAPGGIAVVQVPYKDSVVTDEDPSASPEERTRRFGQADHVRFYGTDFEARLENAGLVIDELRVGDILPADLVGLIGGHDWERIWLCMAPADGAPGLPDESVIRERVMDELAAAVAAATERSGGPATSGPIGVGPDGLSDAEVALAARDAQLGERSALERLRVDRREAQDAIARGAKPPTTAPSPRPAWQRKLASVLPISMRRRLRGWIPR